MSLGLIYTHCGTLGEGKYTESGLVHPSSIDVEWYKQ